jgi:hypothetical protein
MPARTAVVRLHLEGAWPRPDRRQQILIFFYLDQFFPGFEQGSSMGYHAAGKFGRVVGSFASEAAACYLHLTA